MSGLQIGEVCVWLAKPVQENSPSWPELLLCLGSEEIERSERFAFQRDRQLYVSAHALARLALEQVSGLLAAPTSINATLGERPQIAESHGSNLDLSLSHTDGMVAVAIGRGVKCGVDVEAIDRTNTRGSVGLSETEASYLERHDDPALAFFRYWTLKEAVSKVSGQGLALPFEALQMSPFGTPPEILTGHDAIDIEHPSDGWSLTHHTVGPTRRWAVSVASHAHIAGSRKTTFSLVDNAPLRFVLPQAAVLTGTA